MSSCTTSKRLLASFCEEADYLEWLKAEYDDGTVEWEERRTARDATGGACCS